MPSGMTRMIGWPGFQIAATHFRRGSKWRFSTKAGVGGHSPATQQTKVPRMTNRMRRLARAHPEAVVSASSDSTEESRAKFPAPPLLDEASNSDWLPLGNQLLLYTKQKYDGKHAVTRCLNFEEASTEDIRSMCYV